MPDRVIAFPCSIYQVFACRHETAGYNTQTMAYSHTRSARLFAEAQHVIPGGVNSPVRAFKSVGGDPLFMAARRRAVYL